MRSFTSLAAVLALFLTSHLARADAVRPPPRNCVAGSHGETGHAGPYCTPSTCTTDAECASFGVGLVCTDAPLCVTAVSYTDWSGQMYTRFEVSGPCGGDGSCEAPAVCDTTKKCAPPPTTTSSSGPSGSSGSSGATTGSGAQNGAGGSNTGGEGTGADEERRIDGCDCGVPAGDAGSGAWALVALALGAALRRASRRTEA